MDGNALFVSWEFVNPRHCSEELLIDGAGIAGIGIGYKHAHFWCEDTVLRNEVHAIARSVDRRQNFVEVLKGWLGRTHAYHARDFCARLLTAFFGRESSHRYENTGNRRGAYHFGLIDLQSN